PWVLHAHGTLGSAGGAGVPGGLLEWPPAGAEEVDLSGAYERLAGEGYGYGPVFQGLRRVWRGDGELFAEVSLPEEQRVDAARFGLHPALLDAALHALLPGVADKEARAWLPFAWSGVTVHATGATTLRVRLGLTRPDPDSLHVELTVGDAAGAPVATVDALDLRPLSLDALRAAGRTTGDGLLRIAWTPVGPLPAVLGSSSGDGWVVLAADAVDVSGVVGVPSVVVLPLVAGGLVSSESVRVAVGRVLGVVQAWLADERFVESRLVVVTRGAVSVDGGDVTDLVHAGVWGLLRSAQTENPGRIVLVDVDVDVDAGGGVGGVLGSVVAVGEPQLAVR
ncbi:polyketide synthase dehydratase domain-containing protein, partial [Streptomyces sp. NPDC059165]|uniref:polyketide synthase dehydratase domain-containing protein n=1 Tax=Streptomyces sp. NPDC059165 TaxID=3346751 RepID=UPI0036CA43A6